MDFALRHSQRNAAGSVTFMMQEKLIQERWRFRLLACCVAAYFGFTCWNMPWMARLGVPNWGVWFLDLRTVLAASDAHALGIDPRAHNPLDYFHSPHVYSDWWFFLDRVGLDRNDYVWLGSCLVFTFLLVAILQLRARSVAEVALGVAVLCSPPVLLGFNRGNVDLFIFLVLSGVPFCVVSPRPIMRWLAIALILIAAALKFYPAAAGLVLLAPLRDRRQVLLQAGLCASALCVLLPKQTGYIQRYFADDAAVGFFTFGLDFAAPQFWAGAAVAFLAAAGVYWWRIDGSGCRTKPVTRESLSFLMGAALLLGSYLVTVNYGYRAIFSIWMAPYLWSLSRPTNLEMRSRLLARVTIVLLLAFLWSDGLVRLVLAREEGMMPVEWVEQLRAAEQPIALALMVALLGFILPFIRAAWRHLLAPEDKTVRPTVAQSI